MNFEQQSARFQTHYREFIEWLDVTGCIPEHSSWRYELESFFEDFYKAGRVDEKEGVAPEADKSVDRDS